DPDEPLLRAYAAAVEARAGSFHTMTTFIGSDASAFRRYARVFTVSTGAMEEHTTNEYIALAPLAELVETTVVLRTPYHAPYPRLLLITGAARLPLLVPRPGVPRTPSVRTP